MKKKVLILFILLCEYSFSQEIVFPIGYTYNQEHSFHVGVDMQLIEETFFIVGISDNVTFRDRKIKSNLELHISAIPFSSENKSIILSMLMAEFATTKDYFNPSLGLSLFNIVKIKTGYNFPYKLEYQDKKGVTFGLIFSLGSMSKFNIM